MRSGLLALSLLLLIASASDARAHASLLAANPPPGGVVAGDSASIELRFDSRLDPRFSRLALRAADGGETLLTIEAGESSNVMKAKANGLGAGRYHLLWRVLSVDGHANRGEIKFSVEP